MPEQPEIVETADFYWQVKLPDGGFLERDEGITQDRTKFNTLFAAKAVALDWWLDRCADEWNPKVTRQQ